MAFATCVLLVLNLIFLLFLERKYLNKILPHLDLVSTSLQTEIRDSIHPKFIDISLPTKDLIGVATEVWRISQRFSKMQDQLPDVQMKGFNSSLRKLEKYFALHDIEVRSFTNEEYKEGLNVEVLSSDIDPSITAPMIKETVEPMILHRGKVLKKAKVLLLTNGE